MTKVVELQRLEPFPTPSLLDQWFPSERQTHYIQQIRKQINLTQRQAECFVRLWAYLLVKQQYGARKQRDSQQRSPIECLNKLDWVEGDVPCSHREAADLFYANSDRGSDRAAGMMLDKLVKRKLIVRTFDGNISRIQIQPLANIDHGLEPGTTLEAATCYADKLNPRRDTVFATQLLTQYYGWVTADAGTMAHKFKQALWQWTEGYPSGIRVLRCNRPQKVVGIYSLFPAAEQSNVHFFSPPSRGLYLLTAQDSDSLVMAKPGDQSCTVVYIRGWAVDRAYLTPASVQQSLEDMQQTLRQMQQDFPNLCDLYGLSVHPGAEAIAEVLGFQKTIQDSTLPVAWIYIPLEQFLEVDIARAVEHMEDIIADHLGFKSTTPE